MVVDRSLLSLGLFTGRTQGCHLRLRSLNEAPPQFCLQYDERDRWTLVGVGGLVFVNGDLIREETVELKFDDELICDPYVIKVIPRLPNGLSDQDSVPTIESETTLSSLSDTSFVLNLPPARKDSKTLNAGVVPPSSGNGWQCQ